MECFIISKGFVCILFFDCQRNSLLCPFHIWEFQNSVVKEVVQSHTDDTSKRNHWISVLIKIQSSFYLITLGKCAINFRWYRNPSHHSHYSFSFSDLCTIIRCVPLISSVCVCVFSWDTWLGIHLNIISHYNDENQKFKTLKKWNNNTYIFFILKIKFRY